MASFFGSNIYSVYHLTLTEKSRTEHHEQNKGIILHDITQTEGVTQITPSVYYAIYIHLLLAV